MGYRIIRCGSGFGLVVVISPPDADIGAPDARYYRCASWKAPGIQQLWQFDEISDLEALLYFSGQADGLGYETPPEEIFPTLELALSYAREKCSSALEKLLQDLVVSNSNRW